MEIAIVLVVAALTFGGCWLFDKGFEKLFRSQAQHHSGLSVRVNKRYGAFGAIFIALGLGAIFVGMRGEWILIAGGAIILVMGICFVVYYATFGIFYDEDSFILTTFGRKSQTYRYEDIKGQRLYLIQGGNIVVELHMTDGRTVSIQSAMTGAYAFLDHAFYGWCSQNFRVPEECEFHDPANHLWFPTVEEV